MYQRRMPMPVFIHKNHFTPFHSLSSNGIESWRLLLKNDFEETVFRKYPAIEEIKEKLYASGAMYASMSGSGASVYAIFESAINLEQQFPGATVWSAPIP